jgi:hypothetical protein
MAAYRLPRFNSCLQTKPLNSFIHCFMFECWTINPCQSPYHSLHPFYSSPSLYSFLTIQFQIHVTVTFHFFFQPLLCIAQTFLPKSQPNQRKKAPLSHYQIHSIPRNLSLKQFHQLLCKSRLNYLCPQGVRSNASSKSLLLELHSFGLL